jgi:hypothetical protein
MTFENNDQHEDAELDRVLADHIAGELTPRLGGAEQRFLASVAMPSPWRRILAAAAVLLIAGSLGVVQFERRSTLIARNTLRQPTTDSSADTTPRVQCVIFDQTIDAGGAEVNGEPGHAYRREIVEQTEQYDPKTHITIQTTVPREQLVLETLEQY